MTWKCFARLTNGLSKMLTNHAAAVSPNVAYDNLGRIHETLRTTSGVARGMADQVWTIGGAAAGATWSAPSKTQILYSRGRKN